VTGAAIGGGIEALIEGLSILFLKGEQRDIGEALRSAGGKTANTSTNRRRFGDFIEDMKESGIFGSKNNKGDFNFQELKELAKQFLEDLGGS